MATIKLNGEVFAVTPNPTAFLEQMKGNGLSVEDYTVEFSGEERSDMAQEVIAQKYGNGDRAVTAMRLIGTTADAAQVLVLFACADAVALASAADFAAYKQSRMDALTAISGSEDAAANIVQQAGQLLADVQSGAVLMPFLVKPDRVTGVFRDVAERATGVAQALAKPETVSA